MNPREWALVAFTLLMQTSVGVLLVVAAFQAFASRTAGHGSARLFDLPLLVAAVSGVLALIASLLHLGHPLQAWLALTNLRASWLSREVLLAALFVACAGVYALLARTGAGSPGVRAISCLAAVALGVLVVAAMARLYMVPAQPAWNRALTPVGFVVTTLLLGIIVVMLAADPDLTGGAPPGEAAGRLLLVVAIVLLMVQVVLLPAQMAAFVSEPAAAISTGSARGLTTWLAAVRALAAIVSIVVLALWGRTIPVTPAVSGLVLLLMVFTSELCGRLLFYSASVHLGPV